LDECIRANVLADRCDRYQQNELEKQVEAADRKWEQERRRKLNALVGQLGDDPAAAVAGLKGFAHGCRWMIARYEQLRKVLLERGYWTPDELHEAIRLHGIDPAPAMSSQHVISYMLNISNLGCTPEA